MPRKAIIAIFGGDKRKLTIDQAFDLGKAIAHAGHIVLTGGSDCSMKAPKNAAICGAGASPWIGVVRSGNILINDVNGGVVIDTDLGHRRNYLEAALCDAAVGIMGSRGTSSELTFALALGKPVAFFGNHWEDEFVASGFDDPSDQSKLISQAISYVNKGGSRRIDYLLDKNKLLRRLNHVPKNQIFPTEKDPAKIVEWLLHDYKISRWRDLPGEFPFIDGYDTAKEEFEYWLNERTV